MDRKKTDSLVCDTCGREESVRTVQMRCLGQPNQYSIEKRRLCRACRDKKAGSWRYWR